MAMADLAMTDDKGHRMAAADLVMTDDCPYGHESTVLRILGSLVLENVYFHSDVSLVPDYNVCQR